MINIQAILKDYSITFDPNVNPGWLNICCPFCHHDAGYHGGFNLAGEYFHCWKCGGHSLRSTLKLLLHLDSRSYEQFILQYSTDIAIRARLNKKIPKAKKIELPGKPELTKLERKYLKSRGFNPDFLIEKYGICSGGTAGKWKYRIIIPIFLNGRIVSFTSRTIIKDKKPRYLTLPIEESVIDPKSLFYNIDNAKSERVCVVEGPTDVWRMGDDFICSLGTSMVEAQIQFLARTYKEVLYMFDSEPEAQRNALKYAERLSVIGGVDVTIIDTESKADPGSFTDKHAKLLRRKLGFSI
jgi:hypothetical protein